MRASTWDVGTRKTFVASTSRMRRLASVLVVERLLLSNCTVRMAAAVPRWRRRRRVSNRVARACRMVSSMQLACSMRWAAAAHARCAAL